MTKSSGKSDSSTRKRSYKGKPAASSRRSQRSALRASRSRALLKERVRGIHAHLSKMWFDMYGYELGSDGEEE